MPDPALQNTIESAWEARDTVNRITTERQLLQIFGSGLTPADLADVLENGLSDNGSRKPFCFPSGSTT